jgi:hypothetical protein
MHDAHYAPGGSGGNSTVGFIFYKPMFLDS